MPVPKQIRGIETKQKLLECSSELFLEYGYYDTTIRLISKRANTNLGLFNYYFNGKIEIGATVYHTMRSAFDSLIAEYEPSFDDVDVFLFSSALELYLCLEYPNFGKFFVEISHEPYIYQRVINYIIRTFEQYSRGGAGENFARLAGISISSIKPSIVSYSLSSPDAISNEEYINYYLLQHLHFFGKDASLSEKYMKLFDKYHIALDKKMTPIFEPKDRSVSPPPL